MQTSYDATTDEGWRQICLLRHQAKQAGKPLNLTVDSAITKKQFNALHVWCDQVAIKLNLAGLDMRKVMKPEVSMDWTKHSVKEYLYKPVLEAMTGKESTKEQDKAEPSQVAETIARHMAEKFGVTLPFWPKREV